jgi:hypothetical protein
MGGNAKTSTNVVITKVPPSLYLRSKMETASVATPKLSGHLRIRRLKILLLCSSTFPNKGTSHSNNKQNMRLGATASWDLCSLDVIHMSYVHMNLLMERIIAVQMQIRMVTRYRCKVGRIC